MECAINNCSKRASQLYGIRWSSTEGQTQWLVQLEGGPLLFCCVLDIWGPARQGTTPIGRPDKLNRADDRVRMLHSLENPSEGKTSSLSLGMHCQGSAPWLLPLFRTDPALAKRAFHSSFPDLALVTLVPLALLPLFLSSSTPCTISHNINHSSCTPPSCSSPPLLPRLWVPTRPATPSLKASTLAW